MAQTSNGTPVYQINSTDAFTTYFDKNSKVYLNPRYQELAIPNKLELQIYLLRKDSGSVPPKRNDSLHIHILSRPSYILGRASPFRARRANQQTDSSRGFPLLSRLHHRSHSGRLEATYHPKGSSEPVPPPFCLHKKTTKFGVPGLLTHETTEDEKLEKFNLFR